MPTTLPRSRSPHNVLHSPSNDSVSDTNWASMSEPHTCDFNATFLCIYIYIYISICDRHCTSKIAINISIFHLGCYTRRARAIAPTRSGRPHPFSKPLLTGAEQ